MKKDKKKYEKKYKKKNVENPNMNKKKEHKI
jgi:hypothetical protein